MVKISDFLAGQKEGSKYQEYVAMLVGDVIQFQIILSRHSTSANMRNPISTHTVDLNNTNKAQLINDLDQWIGRYEKKIHVDLPYN